MAIRIKRLVEFIPSDVGGNGISDQRCLALLGGRGGTLMILPFNSGA